MNNNNNKHHHRQDYQRLPLLLLHDDRSSSRAGPTIAATLSSSHLQPLYDKQQTAQDLNVISGNKSFVAAEADKEKEKQMTTLKHRRRSESGGNLLHFNVSGKLFMVFEETFFTGNAQIKRAQRNNINDQIQNEGRSSIMMQQGSGILRTGTPGSCLSNSFDSATHTLRDSLQQFRTDSAASGGRGGLLCRFAASSSEDRCLIADRYFPESDTYFFDQNHMAFAAVLDYYRDGCRELHFPTDLCPEKFLNELRFWEIDPAATLLSKCCLERIFDGKFALMAADEPQTDVGSAVAGVYDKVMVGNETARSMVLSIQGPEDPLHSTSSAGNELNLSASATNIHNDLRVPTPSFGGSEQLNKNPTELNGSVAEKKASFLSTIGISGVGGSSAEQLAAIHNGRQLPPSSDMFTGAPFGSCRRKCWIFLEDANSSRKAKLFSIVSVGFVLLSVVCLIIGSIPECQVPENSGTPHVSLIIMEYAVIGWFTFEYLIRLLITTERCAYIKSGLVIIDFIAIFPFYVELALEMAGVDSRSFSNLKGALLVVRTLRVLRVARILRLARYSDGMKSCAETLKASMREIGMLILFVCTMITMFSTTVYFMEKDYPGTEFRSIPATFWWCIVSNKEILFN